MRVRRPTWLSTALLACATAIFLAGCGATTTADPPASPPPASPTATAPTPPSLPPGASKHTKAGAIAFVRHYVSLINYAQATGDTRALAAVEAKKCRSCADARANVKGAYRNGGRLIGGKLHITQVIAVLTPHSGATEVDVAIRFDRQTVVRPGRSTHLSGGKNVLSIFLQDMPSTSWEVSQWTRAN